MQVRVAPRKLPEPKALLLRVLVAALVLCAWLGRAESLQAAPAARVHVKYWEKWTGIERDAMQAVVDDFNRSQERIFVDYMAVSAVGRKTLIAVAGGNPPDLAGVVAQDVFDFADKQALLPLDEWATGTSVAEQRYLAPLWRLGVFGGRLFGVVSVPALNALHWNKRLFREAGLDPERPPKSLAELDAYAERLTRVENGVIVQMGFLPSEPSYWAFIWPYFFGGRLWDGGARITLAEPQNVRAFQWIQGYAKTYGLPALQNLTSGFGNVASAHDPFLTQKLAMVLQGVWMSNYADSFAKDLEWGAAPFPSSDPAAPPVTFLDADMLVVPRGAAHPREAFEFIRYLSEQAHTEKLCLLQRKTSPLVEVSEHFYQTHKNPYIRMFQGLAHSPGAASVLPMSVWSEYRTELHAMFQRVWLLQATPEAALATTQARMQRSWDRARDRQARKPSPALRYAPFALLGLLVLAVAGLAARERRRKLVLEGASARRVDRALFTGLAFFSPWGIGLLLFVLYPVMASLVYSFCDYSVLSAPRFVGLANFTDLLGDEVFFVALKNTLIYAILALPLHLFAAFFIALFLDANVRGSGVYRTLVFLPSLTPVVASSMVWLWIFNTRFGILNYLLAKLSFGRLAPIPWLVDPRTALPSLIFMSVWGIGHTVVVCSAAMQDVPTAIYEAAEIDGASLWHKVIHITLPLTSPVIYFNGVMGLIQALQVFSQPYIMTGGGPARATLTYAMRLYDNAFTYLRMGYAAAMAWILFVIILGLTLLALRIGKKRVHYAAG